MTTTLYATFDGEVLRPESPIPLAPDTRVRITVEAGPAQETNKGEPYCFFRTAIAANLDGPPDWSERFHYYLHGEGARSDE
jgi:hypothetical protein